MDGKLTGRLSPRPTLTGRLSAMPRVEPIMIVKTITRNGAYHAADDAADGYTTVIADVSAEPIMIVKTIAQNGTYHAADDEADGYSAVIADVSVEPITPHAFDLTGGYVSSGTWVPGGDTVNYSDSYAVSADETYILALGSIVGSRFRAMFSAKDIAADTSRRIAGKQIANVSNPLPYACAVYKPTEGGFITVTKDNAGTPGIRTYMFCLADLIRGNE